MGLEHFRSPSTMVDLLLADADHFCLILGVVTS
jgi:hypothetical protein